MARRPFAVIDGPLKNQLFAVDARNGDKVDVRLSDGRTAVYRANTSYDLLEFIAINPHA